MATQEFPDNGFPLPMPSMGGAPPDMGVECLDPFSDEATPTVAAASEPWFENIEETEENEPLEGTTNGEDFFEAD